MITFELSLPYLRLELMDAMKFLAFGKEAMLAPGDPEKESMNYCRLVDIFFHDISLGDNASDYIGDVLHDNVELELVEKIVLEIQATFEREIEADCEFLKSPQFQRLGPLAMKFIQHDEELRKRKSSNQVNQA